MTGNASCDLDGEAKNIVDYQILGVDIPDTASTFSAIDLDVSLEE